MAASAGIAAGKKSTIVRSLKPSIWQRMVMSGVGGLSWIAPGIAARFAEQMFLTPPRHAAPERERDLVARAQAGSVRVMRHRVATWTWGSGPRILLVHGWGGRGAQLGAFAEPLVAQGFSVAWFDGPGHGASSGRRVTIPEIATALRAVADAIGPVRGIVAHSGGAVVSGWAVRQWLLDGFVDLPEAIALIAPPADFGAYFHRFSRLCRLSRAGRSRFRDRLEARVGESLEAFDLPRLAGELPLAALVVHDHEDAEVPWTAGAAVAAAWRGAELMTTGGLGHRRILRDSEVVTRVTGFLVARVPRDRGHREERAELATLC